MQQPPRGLSCVYGSLTKNGLGPQFCRTLRPATFQVQEPRSSFCQSGGVVYSSSNRGAPQCLTLRACSSSLVY